MSKSCCFFIANSKRVGFSAPGPTSKRFWGSGRLSWNFAGASFAAATTPGGWAKGASGVAVSAAFFFLASFFVLDSSQGFCNHADLKKKQQWQDMQLKKIHFETLFWRNGFKKEMQLEKHFLWRNGYIKQLQFEQEMPTNNASEKWLHITAAVLEINTCGFEKTFEKFALEKRLHETTAV